MDHSKHIQPFETTNRGYLDYTLAVTSEKTNFKILSKYLLFKTRHEVKIRRRYKRDLTFHFLRIFQTKKSHLKV